MTSCETGVQISGKGKCALDSVFIDASRGLGLSVVGEGSVLQGAHVRVNGSYRHGLEIGGHASADLR